jgi:predicted RNA-binding protein YlxR (DUF448 family)
VRASANPTITSRRGAVPVRTCVGCRDRAPASTLLRVVAVADADVIRLVVDPRHRLPGRGAYLHVDPACLAKAERRRAFGRALRVAGVLDTGAVTSYVTAQRSPTDATAGETGKPSVGPAHPDTKVGHDRHEHPMNTQP